MKCLVASIFALILSNAFALPECRTDMRRYSHNVELDGQVVFYGSLMDYVTPVEQMLALVKEGLCEQAKAVPCSYDYQGDWSFLTVAGNQVTGGRSILAINDYQGSQCQLRERLTKFN